MAVPSRTRDSISEGIEHFGEAVRVINSVQTTDSDYGSISTDDFIDGTNTGTEETAVIQPVKRSREQMAEGRLLEGDMIGFFKQDSVITTDSLVKVDGNSYLYKVKALQPLKVSGYIYHYEAILEFVRIVT